MKKKITDNYELQSDLQNVPVLQFESILFAIIKKELLTKFPDVQMEDICVTWDAWSDNLHLSFKRNETDREYDKRIKAEKIRKERADKAAKKAKEQKIKNKDKLLSQKMKIINKLQAEVDELRNL